MFTWLRKKRYQVTTNNGEYKIINSTYDAIADFKTAGTLKPGWKYRFTYNTKYQQLVTGTILTGSDETLIISATSANTFDIRVQSVQFPDDLIDYDFDDDLCEDGITDRPGFIIRREDTINGNSTPFDFRKILFRRYALDTASINDFVNTNPYVMGDIIKDTDYTSGEEVVYVCTFDYTSTVNFQTDLYFGYWKQLFSYGDNLYVAPNATANIWPIGSALGTTDIPVLSGTFVDVTIFQGATCKNVVLSRHTSTSRFAHNVTFMSGGTNTEIYITGNVADITIYGANNNFISIDGSMLNSLIYECLGMNFGKDSSVEDSYFKGNFYSVIQAECKGISVIECTSLTVLNSYYSSFFALQGSCMVSAVNVSVVSNSQNSSYSNLAGCKLGDVAGVGITNSTIENAYGKFFEGNYTEFYYRGDISDTNSQVYSSNYANVVANMISPGNGVFYTIVDDGGTITADYIQ